MENRSNIYIALDKLSDQPTIGGFSTIVQPIEIIPFDDKEYQLQLRLVPVAAKVEIVFIDNIDKEKVMDAVNKLRADNKLGLADEIYYTVDSVMHNNYPYNLQVVMTSTHIIGDKLWSL